MLPSFFGLNTVTRALLAQQEAVDVVNQNIANASTPGYSRQQAIISATDPYTAVAFDRPALPGQLGTGAEVTKINRFVDELLNTQIRDQTQSQVQFETMDGLYTQVQAIFNDPSDIAVNQASVNFYNAVHDVSNNPESIPAREALQQQGQDLATAVTSRYQQLTSLQQDLNVKVQTIVADVNTTIRQIAALNTQIAQVTGIGDNANDLEDQRDLLVDHLSGLVDTHDVKNPDGTDTIQLNGRFLVNKDQAYLLQTLSDASSAAYVKPVKVFWQEDISKFQNMHPGYDPITGKNLTTGAALSPTANPPLSVSPTDITTGSLYGAMQIRDQVIQDTLIPQLNELADSLTNTQVLSSKSGLDPNAKPVGGTGSFVISVLTPQGQTVTFNPSVPSGSAPTTVQGVIDAINGSVVSPYVHASLNAAGQLQIDTTQTGTLVKVDQADAVASKVFGFSESVADGFNAVHVQGFGLDTPPQWTGAVSGLTLNTPMASGDGITITGPDGVPVNIELQPPLTDPQLLATTAIGGSPFTSFAGQPSSPQNLAVAINGATGSGTVAVKGTDQNGNTLTETLNFNGNGILTTVNKFTSVSQVTVGGSFGAAATLSVTALSTPNTVQDLVNAINSVSQTDTQAIGAAPAALTPLTAIGAGAANFTITVVRPDGQTVTFDPNAATPGVASVQDVMDAINGTGKYLPNTVSGFVRAFINPQGNLEIDSTAPGALVKVDQASTAANALFGFQTGTLPAPVGQEHGFQAALDAQGRLIVSSQPTLYGPSGQLQSIAAQVVGSKAAPATFTAAGSMTITGPNGSQTFNWASGSALATLIGNINTANLGVIASVNSVGQFQLTTQQIGPNATITVTGTDPAATNSAQVDLGLRDGSAVGQRRGYPPSAALSVQALTSTFTNVAAGTYAGAGPVYRGSADVVGTANPSINSPNQFFFDGAAQVLQNQVLPPTATASASGQFPKTLVSPGQVAFTLVGANTFGTVTVNGLDANGNAISDTLAFTGNGTLTTSNYYKTITSITVPGTMNTGTLQAVGLISTTQYDTANALAVDGNILKDPSLIAASSTPDDPGNQANALALLNVQQNATISDGQQAATLGDFYSSAITDLGDAAQEVHTTRLTQEQLVQHLTNQKQSVVGVSIDEEASNLVALQHAYEAAARAITTQDSMLDTIINGMGLVGR